MLRFWPSLLPMLICVSAGSVAQAAVDEFFESRIRPLLAEHCYKCHSAKSEKLKGGLLLDSRQGLLKGGESGRPAVVPGDPARSLLIEAVRFNGDVQMPPRKKLSDGQIADLVKWVEQGAPWPGESATAGVHTAESFNLQQRARSHWAYAPVVRPPLPPVQNAAWPRSAVDRFILSRLEAEKLSPVAEAERRTLIRRVYFDLIGLPPTPDAVERFVTDTSPDAFEKVVDHLLASPQYGERWARHWLDLVRYAETAGHEFDFDNSLAYLYRDYVIRAFNSDLPYDQFVREHVAGDLLPEPRRHPDEKYNESIIATGFWHLGESVHSPVDVREDEGARVDNQIDVFAKTFTALTVACARCHDHKFDAISTRDYYALCGYMRSSRYQEAFIDPPDRFEKHHKELAALQARLNALTAAAMMEVRLDPERLDRWAQSISRIAPPHPLFAWSTLSKQQGADFAMARQKLLDALRSGKASVALPGSYITFADFSPREASTWYSTGHAFQVTAVPTLLFSADPAKPLRSALPSGVATSGLLAGNLQGALRSPTFTISHDRVLYRVAGRGATVNLIVHGFQRIREPIYGGLTFKVNSDQFQWHVQDVSRWKGHRAYIELLDNGPEHISIDQVLFSNSNQPPDEFRALIAGMLADDTIRSPDDLAKAYRTLVHDAARRLTSGDASVDEVALINHLLTAPPEVFELSRSDLADLLNQLQRVDASLPAPRKAMAMADGTAYDEQVFIRGSYKTPGQTVPRRFLEALAGPDQLPPSSKGSGRLDLAHRLTAPGNPLLARVMVNRIWKHHFGEGIVRSVDDFGVMGSPPSHPQLLDYLADEFRAGGWSIKKMHRMMVLSSTYRMSSDPSPDALQRDPTNALLSHMPRKRLEAEAIRDAILAVSGRLDLKMFGSSVPPHLTPFMQGRGRPSTSGPLDGDGRRSIYIQVRRNFLTPFFASFDYPVPFTTIGRRTVSNVPAQALAMMNNPFVLEQARLWAARTLSSSSLTTDQRIHRLYMQAFSRPPTEDELAAARTFLAEAASSADGDAIQPWADLCHVLINLKEFIFIN